MAFCRVPSTWPLARDTDPPTAIVTVFEFVAPLMLPCVNVSEPVDAALVPMVMSWPEHDLARRLVHRQIAEGRGGSAAERLNRRCR
jgi:hypothetical protein